MSDRKRNLVTNENIFVTIVGKWVIENSFLVDYVVSGPHIKVLGRVISSTMGRHGSPQKEEQGSAGKQRCDGQESCKNYTTNQDVH